MSEYKDCPHCEGMGREMHGCITAPCFMCKATGKVLCPLCGSEAVRISHDYCDTCEREPKAA